MRYVLFRRIAKTDLMFYNIQTGWEADPRKATIFAKRPTQLAKDLGAFISVMFGES